jgi:hypothetical protein
MKVDGTCSELRSVVGSEPLSSGYESYPKTLSQYLYIILTAVTSIHTSTSK